ncbi:MAG: iron-sulfur cluster-binding domain-containing protein [Pseudomonadales bacterium]
MSLPQPQVLGRKLLAPLVSPDQFDFWAGQLGSIAAWERCYARVMSAEGDASHVKLALRPNGNWRGFRAGQRCNVTARIGGRNITRSYRLDIAADAGLPAITVRRVAGGGISNWLLEHGKPGMRLELGAPYDNPARSIKPLAHQHRESLPAAGSEGMQRVTLSKSGISVEVAPDANLLDALESHGIAVKSGCRRGICNTCSCVKASGATHDIYSGAEHNEPLQRIKLCSSRASSALTLEL